MRGWGECLSPEHSGMKALGGIVSTVRTRGSLLYLSWTLPPGHCHLLFSSFKVCNVIHCLQENTACRLKALWTKMSRQTLIYWSTTNILVLTSIYEKKGPFQYICKILYVMLSKSIHVSFYVSICKRKVGGRSEWVILPQWKNCRWALEQGT